MDRQPGWESVDVRNPSVVRQGNRLFNFYSGYDGKTWHTGVATSTDGFSWQERKTRIDAEAALVILQSWFDSHAQDHAVA